MEQFRYRPEIDGLRALAVLAVVFFHAGLGLPGGYVGVDVFFVISGYLITALLIREIGEDRFTLIGFWERRVRRLFPALFVVVLATLAVGFVIDLPHEYDNLARSAEAQALLMANFFFWEDSGYFAVAAEAKPLLHTWSLAVEEQFYLLFPLVLLFFSTRAVNRARLMIWTVFIVSLAWSVYGTTTAPNAAFYLLPARAWELMLGALLAVYADRAVSNRAVNEALSWGGLAAIVAACVLLTRDTPFPGSAALLPCLGTAAVIFANQKQLTAAGRVLSLRPVVFVGLISYSLYLWHWPIFVYGKRMFFDRMDLGVVSVMIALSALLAVLSWRFVETPIRKRRLVATRKSVFAMAIGGTALTIALAVGIKSADGLPQRMPPEVIQLTEGAQGGRDTISRAALADGRLWTIGAETDDSDARSFLVWGDSHAIVMVEAIDRWAKGAGVSGYGATRAGTLPIPETWRSLSDSDGRAFNAAAMEFIRDNAIKDVVLVGRWTVNVAGRPDGRIDSLITDSPDTAPTRASAHAVFERRLRHTIGILTDAGVRVWIMRQVPLQSHDVPRTLAAAMILGRQPSDRGVTREAHLAHRASVDRVFDGLADPNVSVLNPDPYLFDEAGRSILMEDGRSLYLDENHLSTYGAQRLRPMLDPMFEKIAPPRDQPGAS